MAIAVSTAKPLYPGAGPNPHVSRARAIQELRYSDLGVDYYAIGLRCLVPASLWLVRHGGSPDFSEHDLSFGLSLAAHLLRYQGFAEEVLQLHY